MPSWKKVAVSGSSPIFNHITASGNISASGTLSAGNITSGPAGGSEGGQITLLSQVGGSTNWNVDNYQDRMRIFKENAGGGGGAEYISVRNTGLVGFGNDSPTARVDISGDLRTTGTDGHITASGNISASGDIFADNYYLYLSGTPFRAIASGEFIEEQIFNWTYSDEQKAKDEWKGDNNPYASLPRMVMLTYQLPDSISEIAVGLEINSYACAEK